jgi:hypothetical protein
MIVIAKRNFKTVAGLIYFRTESGKNTSVRLAYWQAGATMMIKVQMPVTK